MNERPEPRATLAGDRYRMSFRYPVEWYDKLERERARQSKEAGAYVSLNQMICNVLKWHVINRR